MKVLVSWGCNLSCDGVVTTTSHEIIGVALTQEAIDILTSQYKKEHGAFQPFVFVREFEVKS